MHFVTANDVDSPDSSSHSNGSGYSSNYRTPAGYLTAPDRFTATTDTANIPACDSSAADRACGCSNPTGL
uniref:Uncharacterized protein n=1 Tax=Romanomermis culicivorax TaxID=13658 RepID=A0A915KWG8_ROMCU